jgi:hypothetical protein
LNPTLVNRRGCDLVQKLAMTLTLHDRHGCELGLESRVSQVPPHKVGSQLPGSKTKKQEFNSVQFSSEWRIYSSANYISCLLLI